MPIRVPERYFSREEAADWPAKLRRELPLIKAWLLVGTARLEACPAAGIDPTGCH